MIDDKKIEEAATVASISDTEKGRVREDYVINALGDHESGFREGYIEGAKWAINEFLKDLWHPISEIPEIGRIFIMDAHYCDGRIELYSRIRCETFHNPLDPTTQKWFYLDDLFPKKGGKLHVKK